MIKRILIFVVVVVIIGLVFLWFVAGGAGAVARTAGSMGNPISFLFGNGTSTQFIKLPWQVSLTRGPDISGYVDEADRQLAESNSQDAYQQDADPQEAQSFGNPSPYVGAITLGRGDPKASSPYEEYIEINAVGLRTTLVITGWSLQSAVSGVRSYIPQGASRFVMGTVNTVQPISIEPGGSAILTTGASPVGVSFRENVCSGYLEGVRDFTPEILLECPAPADLLPATADNIRVYGSPCIDYVASLPRCAFPGTQAPAGISGTCRSFLANVLTYNGCVNVSKGGEVFASSSWRIFLNRTAELWSNSHDVIRLLDSEGRVVDVLSY
ncbi:MAG: hypothetical protein U1D26_01960 [Patescibacteria group bacterium]|nr:hypothetical protein [Patescibacteria group bacterium]